jgi:hypothetical protein
MSSYRRDSDKQIRGVNASNVLSYLVLGVYDYGDFPICRLAIERILALVAAQDLTDFGDGGRHRGRLGCSYSQKISTITSMTRRVLMHL